MFYTCPNGRRQPDDEPSGEPLFDPATIQTMVKALDETDQETGCSVTVKTYDQTQLGILCEIANDANCTYTVLESDSCDVVMIMGSTAELRDMAHMLQELPC